MSWMAEWLRALRAAWCLWQTAKDWGLLQTNGRHSGWPPGLHHAMQTAQMDFHRTRNLHEFTSLVGASIECRSAMAQKLGLKWGQSGTVVYVVSFTSHSCHIHVIFGLLRILAYLLASGKLRLCHEEVGPCTYPMSRSRKWYQCGMFSYTLQIHRQEIQVWFRVLRSGNLVSLGRAILRRSWPV